MNWAFWDFHSSYKAPRSANNNKMKSNFLQYGTLNLVFIVIFGFGSLNQDNISLGKPENNNNIHLYHQ